MVIIVWLKFENNAQNCVELTFNVAFFAELLSPVCFCSYNMHSETETEFKSEKKNAHFKTKNTFEIISKLKTWLTHDVCAQHYKYNPYMSREMRLQVLCLEPINVQCTYIGKWEIETKKNLHPRSIPC